jgi:hypothetical protein
MTLVGWVTNEVFSSNLKVGKYRSICLNAEENPEKCRRDGRFQNFLDKY